MPYFQIWTDEGHDLGVHHSTDALTAYQSILTKAGYSPENLYNDERWDEIPSRINTKKMHAFSIYEAAFDEANDYAENTTQYLNQYCDGVWYFTLNDEVATQILAHKVAWDEHENKCANDFWYMVEKPLRELSL